MNKRPYYKYWCAYWLENKWVVAAGRRIALEKGIPTTCFPFEYCDTKELAERRANELNLTNTR